MCILIRKAETIGTVVKIICQRVSMLRHAILRQRHLSNRYLNFEIEYFCVIKGEL